MSFTKFPPRYLDGQAAARAAEENVIVFAETGAGKTMVAELAIKARVTGHNGGPGGCLSLKQLGLQCWLDSITW